MDKIIIRNEFQFGNRTWGKSPGRIDNPELSVVIPMFQEQDVVREVIINLIQVLQESQVSFEIIAVDDGSTDNTTKILKDLSEQHSDHLLVITHPYNKGNGAAIKTGIRKARAEMIACMDGDGQHDPKDILQMIPYMADYDMVVGARTANYRGPWHRKLANIIYNALATRLTRFPVKDLTSGFRLFRSAIVKQYVHLFPSRFSYPTTSTLAFIKGGFNIKYVSINVLRRQGNKSKIKTFREGWHFLVIIFKIIVIFEPLRIFLPTAMTLFLLAIVSTVQSIWFLGRLHVPNSGVLFFIISILIVLLGLIAEQIAAFQISINDKTNH